MSNCDDGVQDRFDVRAVNLLSINKVVDLEIVIAEADFCLADIDRQIKSGFDGPEWERSAVRARGEIEHKKKLAMMKLVAAHAAAAVLAKGQEDSFKTRFMRAAAAELPPEVYSRMFEAAKFKGEAI